MEACCFPNIDESVPCEPPFVPRVASLLLESSMDLLVAMEVPDDCFTFFVGGCSALSVREEFDVDDGLQRSVDGSTIVDIDNTVKQ